MCGILFSLYQSQLLVFRLAPPSPLRRYINTILFLLIALCLVLVHARWFVLRRTVYSVQDQRRGSSVDELMLCACGHDDQVASLDILVFPGYGRFSCAGCEGEDLVDGVFLGEKSQNENHKKLL